MFPFVSPLNIKISAIAVEKKKNMNSQINVQCLAVILSYSDWMRTKVILYLRKTIVEPQKLWHI